MKTMKPVLLVAAFAATNTWAATDKQAAALLQERLAEQTYTGRTAKGEPCSAEVTHDEEEGWTLSSVKVIAGNEEAEFELRTYDAAGEIDTVKSDADRLVIRQIGVRYMDYKYTYPSTLEVRYSHGQPARIRVQLGRKGFLGMGPEKVTQKAECLLN